MRLMEKYSLQSYIQGSHFRMAV